MIVGDDHFLLGRFPGIFLSIVAPFVVLGSLFSATGGGCSLIKLAFQPVRNLRGGPSHAAINVVEHFRDIVPFVRAV